MVNSQQRGHLDPAAGVKDTRSGVAVPAESSSLTVREKGPSAVEAAAGSAEKEEQQRGG